VTACRVTYSTNDWSTGFTATVTITNTGTTPINTWSLVFPFANGQRVTQAWSATVTQSGSQVTAVDAGWNAMLAPGASVGFGFNGTHTGTNPRPASFTLSGTPCTVA
jgi:cellulase/cellobiase CelA1